MASTHQGSGSPQASAAGRRWIVVLLLLICMIAAWQRLRHWQEWPPHFHVMRQYIAALRTRDYWLALRSPASLNDREKAYLAHVPREPGMEPPLTEFATLAAYVAMGRENAAYSVWITTAFWLAAGLMVYAASGQLTTNPWSRLVAAAFFLTIPAGVLLSRTFQPEPLMLLGFVVALWWLLRMRFPVTWTNALLFGVGGGLLLLPKPGYMYFMLAGAVVGVGLREMTIKQLLLNGKFYLVLLLLALPSALWIKLLLPGVSNIVFIPAVFANPNLYLRSLRFIDYMVGLPAFAVAVIGSLIFAKGRDRGVYSGLLIGYLAFVAATNYRSMTHVYYHAQAIVLVSFALIPVVDKACEWAKRGLAAENAENVIMGVAIAGLAVWMSVAMWQYSTPIRRYAPVTDTDYDEIRRVVGPEATVVAMTDDYGLALRYHSALLAQHWARPADLKLGALVGEAAASNAQRLQTHIDDGATYFVITSQGRFNDEYPFVQELLKKYEAAAAKEGSYVIFNLQKSLPSPAESR